MGDSLKSVALYVEKYMLIRIQKWQGIKNSLFKNTFYNSRSANIEIN